MSEASAREAQVPQGTPSSFLETLEPSLQFVAPTDEVLAIPKGALTCCRVQHQPGCDNHIARTLVGAASRRRWPTGETDEWVHPHPVSMEGDILGEPTKLFAAVKSHWMLAMATAKAQDAVVYEMTIGVFSLGISASALYEEITTSYRERIMDARATRGAEVEYAVLDAVKLEAMPVEYLDMDDEVSHLGLVTDLRFVPVEAYADRIMVFPNEVGHDAEKRYVSGAVWVAPEQEAMKWQPDPDPFPQSSGTPPPSP